jgi:hypothetical protein
MLSQWAEQQKKKKSKLNKQKLKNVKENKPKNKEK